MRPLSLLLAALPLALVACGDQPTEAATVLRFSAIPDDNSTELKQKFDRVADYLSEQLGVEVEYVPSSDYGASVQAFKNGDIQLAWFGGLTGVQARAAVDGAQAIAQGKVDPQYKSYFIAHASTGIQPSDDFPMALEGKTFTFGSERSTSGRLMPEHFIRENTGRAPSEFFAGEPGFSGSHDKTATLVEAGTYDSGAINYKTYDNMVASGEIDPAVCVKIWTTPYYADYNWTVHPAVNDMFGDGTVERIQEALVGMEDPELLAAVVRPEGLIPAKNSDFDGIKSLAQGLGFLE